MTDYRNCGLRKREELRIAAETAALILAADYLFFLKWEALLFLLPFGLLYARIRIQAFRQLRLKKLRRDFREALRALSVNIGAGRSAENAFIETERDLRSLLGEEADMTEEAAHVSAAIRLRRPVGELLHSLAVRTGDEDIGSFASVFVSAEKSGGDLQTVLREAAETIGDKMEIAEEIESAVADKKYEQRILSLMPAAIILYMRFASPGFLDVLYTTAAGMAVMAACLGVYAGAVFWGSKITDINI